VINADGQTVLTDYRNGRKPDQTLHVYSVTKSVLSALIGIALDEQLIKDLDLPLAKLLPRHRAQMTGDLARVTLRQLMTMSAGFPDDDSTPSLFGDVIRQDGDAVTFILKRGLVSPPGEIFTYSNSSAHLVSAVLAQAVRQADGRTRGRCSTTRRKSCSSLSASTRATPTRPDSGPTIPRRSRMPASDGPPTPKGINIGAGQLRLRPADMLKFGQLYLDHGKWHGKQLVPEKWVAASVAPSPTSSQYGFMWWLETTPSGDSAYAARGFGGQLIVVVPEHRLVVAVASQPTEDYATSSQDVFALVSDVILTTFH
jgi:CubicO group peptidase (beta-lactamase class C family)